MEQLVGHALARVDELKKATNELDTKQNAMTQLMDAKQAATAELVNAKQAATAELVNAKQNASAELMQALLTQVHELRTDNQSLRARLDALERQPKHSGSSGSARPATLAEIVERRDALREIKQAGIDCRLARATGYSCAEARQAGYPLLEAKAAGWSSDELRMAGYISSKGMSSREFFDRYQAGTTNFSGLDFSGEDFSRMVIDKACTFAGCDLTDATFDHATLCGIDFASSQMARVDMSHARVQRCDFASTDLSNVDLSHAALHDCTFPNSSLHTARWASAKITGGAKTSKPFKALGFACSEARSLGLLEGLRQAGYSSVQAKQAGYSCAEAKQAGYLPHECSDAGFTFSEGKQSGYRQNVNEYCWTQGASQGYSKLEYNRQYGEQHNRW